MNIDYKNFDQLPSLGSTADPIRILGAPLAASCASSVASSLSLIDVSTTFCPPPPPPPSQSLTSLSDYDHAYVDPERATRDDHSWTAYARRLIHQARANLWTISKGHWNDALYVTLTFSQEPGITLDTLEAQRLLNQARSFLDRLFVYYFFVLEPDDNGIPHFEGIAIARGNIRWGWNQIVWEKMQRRESTDGQLLTHNRRLVKIWDELRQHFPGRTSATPIISLKRVISYVTKKLNIPGSQWSQYRPGTRRTQWSKYFHPVVVSTRFSWNTPRTRLARQKKSAIAASLRISPQRCQELFDSKQWHWHMAKLISALDAQTPRWYKSPNDVIENLVIDRLDGLDFGWAKSLSSDLSERRWRHLRGEPEDPPPQRNPGDAVREDMEAESERDRALAASSPPSIPSPGIATDSGPFEFSL